eukprot:CAMPEP_0116135220 /NCGR_PEP_ID=MMETSP0329-20121206/11076_1 /TAXON_ID=697910 /ORGANISM="Pseudo-nitzschia arenysensis, Strain B593" /LENGTH=417 /DNA_ID=CAMNT_0003630009 /DNA_START=139 /DNA_END=1392 /DNA_ORIENTATION=+
MNDIQFDEVFRLLGEATRLEKSGQHRIEAATKYYESCYLMRQIVENEEANEGSGKKIGSSSCRLLKDKISHYTVVARKLYFDEATMIPLGPQERQQQQQQQQQQPATSVIIGLLDDAISILTESQALPPPIPVPVLGYQQRADTHKNRNFSDSRRGNKTANYNQHNNDANPVLQQQQSKPYHHYFRPTKTPRCALATIERKIHLRANIAHSTLSKALDLDERHERGQNKRKEAISAYMEASELYLGALQLGKEQQSKLLALSRNKRQSSVFSCSSSAAMIETMHACLNGLSIKLKRLLGSALDRMEALSKEEERSRNRPRHLNAIFPVSFHSPTRPAPCNMYKRTPTPVSTNVHKRTTPSPSPKKNDCNQIPQKENDCNQSNKSSESIKSPESPRKTSSRYDSLYQNIMESAEAENN